MMYLQIVKCGPDEEHHFADADDQHYQSLTFLSPEEGRPSDTPPASVVAFQIHVRDELIEESQAFLRFIKEWAIYNNFLYSTDAFKAALIRHYDFERDEYAPRILVIHRDFYDVVKHLLTRLSFEGLLTKPQTVTIL
jgi:hypothetical protein